MSKKKITRNFRRLARLHLLESPYIIAKQLDTLDEIDKLLEIAKESEPPRNSNEQEVNQRGAGLERRGG